MLNWIVWNKTIYLFEMDLALNNLQILIYHKTQTNKQTPAWDKIIVDWETMSLEKPICRYTLNEEIKWRRNQQMKSKIYCSES